MLGVPTVLAQAEQLSSLAQSLRRDNSPVAQILQGGRVEAHKIYLKEDRAIYSRTDPRGSTSKRELRGFVYGVGRSERPHSEWAWLDDWLLVRLYCP